IILDHQDAFAAAILLLAHRRALGGADGAFGARQIEAHGGAAADAALDLDVPGRLLDEAIDLRQAEAGPLADLLGGEEGLENVRQDLVRHALAGVGHREYGIGAGRELAMAGRHFGIAGLDRDVPASGHGVAGVEDEVEKGGLDLIGIGQRGPQLGGELLPDLDMLTHRPMQEIIHADDDLVEVDRLRAELLAAREGQELLRQLLGAARGQRRRGDEAQQPRLVAELAFEQLEIAGNHGQHIVEVVRDAAGELTDRFHLLRLAERVLDATPLGGLAQEADAADHLAAAAVKRREEAVIIAVAAALGDGVALVVERGLAAVERAAHRRLADRADEIGQDVEDALSQDAVDRHPGNALHAGVPQRDAELAIKDDDALGAALDEEFREFLLAPERLLGELVRGDVEMHDHGTRRAADDQRRRHEAIPAPPATLVAGMVDAELR